MGFRINTNIAALNAHKNSVMNNRNLDKSLSRLSSGLRINSAADDASGLAIADSLRAQSTSLTQAISNGNDAIGLLQTADGALSEYSDILTTIKTKAVQAASDTQDSASRKAIQNDISKLMDELNNISGTTSFNGQKLLSGSYTNKSFQLGANSNQTVNVDIASTDTNHIGQTTRSNLNLASDNGGSVQLTLKSAATGDSITLKSVNIQYNNNPTNGMGQLADEINARSGDTGITAKAVVDVTSASNIHAGTTGSDFAINGVIIGAVNVEANDNGGTLLTAINNKKTDTGVSATLTTDGKLSLHSNDGRAIKVSGDVSAVTGSTSNQLSTLGHLELVQAGSSAFQVQGIGTGAVTNKITANGDVTTVKDSILSSGSTIASASVLKAGTVVGGNVSTSSSVATTTDSTLKAGTILGSGSIFAAGTEVGGKVTVAADTDLTQDALLSSGSVLKSGSKLGVGTVIQQDFTDGTGANAVSFTKGQVITSQYTLQDDLTLNADMTLKYNATSGDNSSIKLGSTLEAGSVMGADITQKADTSTTLSTDMTLKLGSTLGANTTLQAGSTVGGDFTTKTDSAVTTYLDTSLKSGSTLKNSSVLNDGSTIGGEITISAVTAGNFLSDMLVKAGSTLGADSLLAKGTVLEQDMTLNTATGGATATEVNLKAGDVLVKDLYVDADTKLAKDMTLKGSTTATLTATTKLQTNTENAGTVGLSDSVFSSLSGVDVSTFDGAMKAIDTISAAITGLDAIRSNIGSSQNQITSTINNISVTQVNVASAESQIRDVDFASESAKFSKFNILAQSGSYAMSQANKVQQNVMRLLQ